MGIFFQLYLKPASADPTIIMLRVVLLLAAFVAFASAGFPADARNMILSEHNKYRKETGAAGMKDLVWDAELEAYAEKMAGECKYRHDPAQKYGENIYWASNEQTAVEAAEGASKAWYSEKAVVDAEWGCYHGKTAKTCGHFSRQVWKNTKKIAVSISIVMLLTQLLRVATFSVNTLQPVTQQCGITTHGVSSGQHLTKKLIKMTKIF